MGCGTYGALAGSTLDAEWGVKGHADPHCGAARPIAQANSMTPTVYFETSKFRVSGSMAIATMLTRLTAAV